MACGPGQTLRDWRRRSGAAGEGGGALWGRGERPAWAWVGQGRRGPVDGSTEAPGREFLELACFPVQGRALWPSCGGVLSCCGACVVVLVLLGVSATIRAALPASWSEMRWRGVLPSVCSAPPAVSRALGASLFWKMLEWKWVSRGLC